MNIYDILDYGIETDASDIHITPNDNIRYRINGELIKKDYLLFTQNIEAINDEILNIKEKEKLYKDKYIDKSMEYNFHRFRIHVYKENLGYSLAIRIIASEIPSIDELNLPSQIFGIKNMKSGLVIITGSTGQGKTTTMASIIEDINKSHSKHIVTIENPIEYRFISKKSLVHQRQVGEDINSLENGVESIVRQDPDIIVLGEMRSKESIKLALSLGELGHLVITTLHSRSSIDTISRIIDVFEGEEKQYIKTQLSYSLEYIINQELIKIKGKRYPVCEILKLNLAMRNIIRSGENLSAIKDQMQMDKKYSIMKDDSYEKIINKFDGS